MFVAGVGGSGALIWGALKWSISRNLQEHDATSKAQTAAITKLTEQVTQLREQGLLEAERRGAMAAEVAALRQRIDGQATYWREQFEKLSDELRSKPKRAR
jgi:hypothetical protein